MSLKIAVIFSPGAGHTYPELRDVARDTTRIRLSVLVTAAQYRNPARLAKIVAGVDQISDGRVEFGIGAGWNAEEYRAYGYEFPAAGARVEQLKDTLEICRRLWTSDRARITASTTAPWTRCARPSQLSVPIPRSGSAAAVRA